MTAWISLLLLIPLVSALTLQRRSTNEVCGQYDTIESSPYTISTNCWGRNKTTIGWQCTALESVKGNVATWYTKWAWTGGNTSVKSFSNIQLNTGLNRQLSAISSMPTAWNWSHECTEKTVADVAYDFFTSYSPGGSKAHEIMIWLASYNTKPISYHYDEVGKAIPVATNLTVGAHTWDLYCGSNGFNEVYSFLPVHGIISTFSGNIHNFFANLIHAGRIASWEYLLVAQAGTEATSGAAFFTTREYSLRIV